MKRQAAPTWTAPEALRDALRSCLDNSLIFQTTPLSLHTAEGKPLARLILLGYAAAAEDYRPVTDAWSTQLQPARSAGPTHHTKIEDRGRRRGKGRGRCTTDFQDGLSFNRPLCPPPRDQANSNSQHTFTIFVRSAWCGWTLRNVSPKAHTRLLFYLLLACYGAHSPTVRSGQDFTVEKEKKRTMFSPLAQVIRAVFWSRLFSIDNASVKKCLWQRRPWLGLESPGLFSAIARDSSVCN